MELPELKKNIGLGFSMRLVAQVSHLLTTHVQSTTTSLKEKSDAVTFRKFE